MANADSITGDSSVIHGCFRLPRVSIPKDFVEADGSIIFKIETHKGTIDVSSWGSRKWVCRGTISALEAGGFLRSDWCPGLPGKPEVKKIMEAEMRSAFNIKRDGFAKSWRVSTSGQSASGMPVMRVFNNVQWMRVHITGEQIGPRLGSAVLIPITRMQGRITTKKFYQLIDMLMRNKQTVMKHGVLYMKPVLNTSARGGVGGGTRINKEFRALMPKNLSLSMNENKLIPIAIVRRSVSMKKRFDLRAIGNGKIREVVVKHVRAALNS